MPIHHEISLICDDLASTTKELSEKGAEFSGEPVDYGYGLMINVRLPAAGEVQLYQPNYQPSYDLPQHGSRAAVLRRSEGTRFSSPSDNEDGGFPARSARSERSERSNQATL